MAMPEPAVPVGAVTIGPRRGRMLAPTWIAVSIVGAVLGALVAGGIRSIFQGLVPASLAQDLAFVGTLVSVVIASGAQWLLLRRWRFEAYWWIPATAAASLFAAAVVVPLVLNTLISQVTFPTMGRAVTAGATALAASGLVVGGAQALLIRASSANGAWLWLAASGLGGALAGAITTALFSQLLGLPAFAVIGLVAAISALLTAACQSPVLARLIR